MLHCNERLQGQYPDMFVKNLKVQTNRTYRLEFEQLGGAILVWINRCFAERGAKLHYFDPCDHWTKREIVFTTSERSNMLAAFENWGISFLKKNNCPFISGFEDVYIDNVQCVDVNQPLHPLLRGGDFEAPRGDAIYDDNWAPMFLGEPGLRFGIDLREDPLDPTNQCLFFPSLMDSPPHRADVPLQATVFGWLKNPVYHSTHRHPIGISEHQLLFVEQGTIRVDPPIGNISISSGEMLYIPPHTPFNYQFEVQKFAQYYWIQFKGDAAEIFLTELPLNSNTATPVPNITALTAHIEQMLQQSRNTALYPFAISSHLQLLFLELKRQLSNDSTDNRHRRIDSIAAQLREITLTVPSNDELAASCRFSTGYFIRLFKSYMGCTPHQYALRSRIDKACTLLKTTSMTIQEISYMLGLDDPQYFSRLFRSIQGVSPSEYRKHHLF